MRLSFQTNEENDSVFKKFICDQETRSEVGRKLSSLLITPVQRVPRYQLLVKQVLQHTPYRHREYRHLQGKYIIKIRQKIHMYLNVYF